MRCGGNFGPSFARSSVRSGGVRRAVLHSLMVLGPRFWRHYESSGLLQRVIDSLEPPAPLDSLILRWILQCSPEDLPNLLFEHKLLRHLLVSQLQVKKEQCIFFLKKKLQFFLFVLDI
jgi:hypothetical protein